MQIKVYKSETDSYKTMNVIGKYMFIGKFVSNDLKKGKIYYRVEPEDEFRIVDDSGEDYLYVDTDFEKIEKTITFYNMNGEIKKEELLNLENISHINGMMSRVYLKDNTIIEGFADFRDSGEQELFLWTWDNLDENTEVLSEDEGEKYKQKFKKIDINDIDNIQTILYLNPRWSGKLTNKFEFSSKCTKNSTIEIPRFLIHENQKNKNEIEEKYYYLTVKYEDYDGYKGYNYISDDYSIEVGDRVLVDRAGNPVIAEVLETEFYNKFEAPFPVEKTKKIIQKVDENFELEDFYVEEELQNKIRFNIDGTKIYFGIENYRKGENNDEDWTNIMLKVNNQYFNYYNNSELMTSAEVERLLKKLEELLQDELKEDENIGFYEPDLEFHLYPKLSLWNTGKYTYIKEGHEIRDIYVELSMNLKDPNGVYTGQKYVLIFDRAEIEVIVKYINEIVK